VILVGHVTKDGQIAGPRVVEHMVDAVSPSRANRPPFPHPARIKNRFGPTDEIGVFEMSDAACRGAEPLRAVPRGRDLARRHRRVRRHGGTRRCSSRSRRSSRRPRSARRGAPSSAGTRAGCPWCCRARGARRACRLGSTTSTSTSPGGLRIADPPPTSPPRRRWSPRSRARPAADTVYSASRASPARSGPWPRRRRAQGGGKARLSARRAAPRARAGSARFADPRWPHRRPRRGIAASQPRGSSLSAARVTARAAGIHARRPGFARAFPPRERARAAHARLDSRSRSRRRRARTRAARAVRGFNAASCGSPSCLGNAAAAAGSSPDAAAFVKQIHPNDTIALAARRRQLHP
jgi:hypothetical protein